MIGIIPSIWSDHLMLSLCESMIIQLWYEK